MSKELISLTETSAYEETEEGDMVPQSEILSKSGGQTTMRFNWFPTRNS